MRNRSASSLLAGRVKSSSAAFDEIDAEALSQLYFNDAIYTNMIMAGYAWQKGSLPISLRGIYRAIRLNGTKIDDNMALVAASSQNLTNALHCWPPAFPFLHPSYSWIPCDVTQDIYE